MEGTKPRRARVPRYRDDEGNHLVVESLLPDQWAIYWFVVSEDDLGMAIGEDGNDTNEGHVIGTALSMFCAANRLDQPKPHRRYVFPSERLAKAALNSINAALNSSAMNSPMPEWAQTALAAGWTPPKGWKP